MLIECPQCFALMRGRAKFCRRCGHELPATPLAATSEMPTPAMLTQRLRQAKSFCVVGFMLLIWGIANGSADRIVLGGFLLILGIAGYHQEKKRACR